jgi:hypothetical protein
MLPPLGDAAVPWWTNTISIMPPIYSLSNALDTSGGSFHQRSRLMIRDEK